MGLRQWWGRVTGGGAADPAPTPVSSVPTEADLLAALDRTEALVAGGAVPGPCR